MIPVWHYVDLTLVTQPIGHGQLLLPTTQQVPNELDQNAAQYIGGSPRSAPDCERGPAMVVNDGEEGDLPEFMTYHANARLMNGRPALRVDPG